MKINIVKIVKNVKEFWKTLFFSIPLLINNNTLISFTFFTK